MTDLTRTIARRFVAGASTLPSLPVSVADQSAKAAGVSFCTGTAPNALRAYASDSRSARTVFGPIDGSAARSVSQWSATSSNVRVDLAVHAAVLHWLRCSVTQS